MIDRVGEVVRNLRSGYRRRFGYRPKKKVVVQLYRGYRSTEYLFVQGRVLEDNGIEVADSDRRWKNFVNAIRRFESDEVAGAKVELDYLGQRFELTADAEGYIELHEEVSVNVTDDPWEAIGARITHVPHGEASDDLFGGEVADLSREARYAVVTDIDDTVLKTHVTSLFKLRALYHTLVDNAHTRLAFPGAPELYEQLAHGPDAEEENNPMFYLSRSPWNLYDMLQDFLDAKGFPKGPIFLRDVGLRYKSEDSEYGHKEGTLLRLIDDFPTLKFILIGDSGERDADIYTSVANAHPERIAAIIIRNVKNNANAHRIQRLFERSKPEQHWYLVKESGEAAEILARLGMLNAEQVASVKAASS